MNEFVNEEIERQLKIANDRSMPREEWEKNTVNEHYDIVIGAYHLGRKEALEDIQRKLSLERNDKGQLFKEMHELWKEKQIKNGYDDPSELTEEGFQNWMYEQIEDIW